MSKPFVLTYHMGNYTHDVIDVYDTMEEAIVDARVMCLYLTDEADFYEVYKETEDIFRASWGPHLFDIRRPKGMEKFENSASLQKQRSERRHSS